MPRVVLPAVVSHDADYFEHGRVPLLEGRAHPWHTKRRRKKRNVNVIFSKKNCLILKQYKNKKAIGRFSSVYGPRLTITISSNNIGFLRIFRKKQLSILSSSLRNTQVKDLMLLAMFTWRFKI